jgi:hypothetical protein
VAILAFGAVIVIDAAMRWLGRRMMVNPTS